jgi:lipopolysaccharide assembly outer membrane protein LptD (OstA)
MNKKIILQIFFLLIIILFIFLLFNQYELNKTIPSTNNTKDIIYSNTEENSSNTINNIKYNSYDAAGNQYKINAKLGVISDKNPSLIIMENVEAEIIFDNNEKIFINSLFATYNIVNNDTIFKGKVAIKYAEHYLNCDNANVFFKDHIVKLYNNVNYTNLDTSLLADEIEIDLLTQNLKIYMVNKKKKVKAIFKNNAPN